MGARWPAMEPCLVAVALLVSLPATLAAVGCESSGSFAPQAVGAGLELLGSTADAGLADSGAMMQSALAILRQYDNG